MSDLKTKALKLLGKKRNEEKKIEENNMPTPKIISEDKGNIIDLTEDNKDKSFDYDNNTTQTGLDKSDLQKEKKIENTKEISKIDNEEINKETLTQAANIKETTNPIQAPTTPTNQVISDQVQQPKKILSLTQVKEEIDKFEKYLTKIEEELFTKHKVKFDKPNLYSDLPEELQIKYIEDFFKQDIIVNILNKINN